MEAFLRNRQVPAKAIEALVKDKVSIIVRPIMCNIRRIGLLWKGRLLLDHELKVRLDPPEATDIWARYAPRNYCLDCTL